MFDRGAPPIAKKKPPSQRPERRLDEVAKAIAAAAAAPKKEKDKAADEAKAERSKPTFSRSQSISGTSKKPNNMPSGGTKRIKSGDG
ncbi:MAG: hypothetical protein SFX72_16650 [Isosphaeraceae bacterium]|nr:hypothetical protein [Isosphaeraceae bacterium]